MGAIAEAFMNPTGPKLGEVTVVAVTTASAHTDLSAEAILAALQGNELITMCAEGDVWYRWSTATTGETVDETATSGNNRASIVFAGERLTERPPPNTLGIVVKAPVACKLRLTRGARPDY